MGTKVVKKKVVKKVVKKQLPKKPEKKIALPVKKAPVKKAPVEKEPVKEVVKKAPERKRPLVKEDYEIEGQKLNFKISCTDHPQYRGKGEPTVQCRGCWQVFSFDANAQLLIKALTDKLMQDAVREKEEGKVDASRKYYYAKEEAENPNPGGTL